MQRVPKNYNQRLLWSKIPSPISFRNGHASVLFDRYIIIVGGSPCPNIGEILVYDIEQASWKRIKPRGQFPNRAHHTACLYGNEIVVFGGHNEKGKSILGTETGVISIKDKDPYLLEWRIIKTKIDCNFKRWHHTANVHYGENKMYVFGGEDSETSCSNELWSLNLKSYHWEQCHPIGLLPNKRAQHLSFLTGGCLYIFGGKDTETCEKLEDLWVLNLKKMRWDNVSIFDRILTHKDELQNVDGKLLFLGGFIDYNEENNLYSYDTELETLEVFSTDLPKPCEKNLQILSLYEKDMYVWAGNVKETFSDLYKLRIIKKEFQDDSEKFYKAMNKKKDIAKPLYLNADLADIIFKVENEEIPAHKVILATHCKFFYNMFTSGMIESKSSSLTIPDVRASTFKAFLQFIYWDELILTEELALELIELADQYVFGELKKECEIFLSMQINQGNLVKIAKIAERIQADLLLERIRDFISRNIIKLQDFEEMERLPENTICFYHDILCNIHSNFEETALTERTKTSCLPNFQTWQKPQFQ